MQKWINPFALIIIFCLGIIVYSNTFSCPFLFDDEGYIVRNFAIQNIHHLLDIWKFYPCRFVTFLSIADNYYFHQLNVFGYHVVNLGVHLVSAMLVWWLTFLTLSTPAMKENKITPYAGFIALFSGLVFVSHPVQVEAVTYICQRAASLATLFYMASLCFYVQSRLLQDAKPIPGPQGFYYILSLLMAVVAMFTKEIAITLPVMILLYEFFFFETKRSQHWKHVFPFLFTLFIIPATMVFAKSEKFQLIHAIINGDGGGKPISSMHYFLTELRVSMTYIRLIFLPLNLNLDYDYPIFKSIFELPVFIGFVSVITILFAAQRLFLKYRLLSFSIVFFFLALLPESSFLPFRDVIFEHRLYLPLVGYSMFLAGSAYYLIGKNNIKAMVIILTIIIAFYSVLTFQRNKVWRDVVVLWNDTIQKSPHKARPYINRGVAYSALGNFDRSMADLNKSIVLDPNFVEAYVARGFVYEKQGQSMRAIIEFTKALILDPVNLIAYYKRGMLFKKIGEFPHAIADFTKIIELAPNDAGGYTGRGVVFSAQGNYTQATADFNKSIELDPDFAEAYQQREIAHTLLDGMSRR